MNWSDGVTDLVAERTPVLDRVSNPRSGLARQLNHVALSGFGAVARAAQVLQNLSTNIEGNNFDPSKFGES